MISIAEAIELVAKTAKTGRTVTIGFGESAGHVLAEDVISDIDMPPFNKSAVDGYACIKAEIGKPLKVLELIPAGSFPKEIIVPGTCSKIMTGAKVPDGADCIVMVEYTSENDGIMTFTGTDTAPNFALAGEDAAKGQVLIKKGTLIEPRHIAVMASAGHTKPVVYSKPAIVVFATGNELVEPDEIPGPGQIRNSNGIQTVSQCKAIGFNAVYGGIIPDDREITRKRISDALIGSDVVILSGGVSKGDLDYIPGVMQELGFTICFDSIMVQPGKPTTLAVKENKFILGLPGNPVSSLLLFNIVGKKLLYGISGFNYEWKSFLLRMGKDYRRNKSERTGFVPVFINSENEIEVIRYNGSANIQALTNATGFLQVDAGVKEIRKGDYATYRPL